MDAGTIFGIVGTSAATIFGVLTFINRHWVSQSDARNDAWKAECTARLEAIEKRVSTIESSHAVCNGKQPGRDVDMATVRGDVALIRQDVEHLKGDMLQGIANAGTSIELRLRRDLTGLKG